jgi:hypothetical protein
MITQPTHDEIGRYKVQCWPKARRIGPSRALQTVIVRKGRLTKLGWTASKHGAAPARVNKGQGAASRPAISTPHRGTCSHYFPRSR